MRKSLLALYVGGLLLSLATLPACSNKITADQIRSDMSPELHTMALNEEQKKNRHARTIDTNGRQIHDDMDEFLFLDRPMRLTKYPVP